MMFYFLKITFFFILGAIFGSFGSVLVFRLMRYQYVSKHQKLKIIKSIILGRSYCPKCGTKLRGIDLIPIVSYLLTRGKCRYCGMKISSIYLWLEIVSGIIFVFFYILLSKLFVENIYFRIFYICISIFFWFFWLLVIADILYYYLIEILWILWFLWTAFGLFIDIGDLKAGFIGGITFLFGFLVIYFFSKLYVRVRFKRKSLEGFGFGDVMVGFILGLGLGYVHKMFNFSIQNIVFYFLIYIILSSLIGIIFAIIMFLYNKFLKKQNMGGSIPFLPSMFVAYVVLILVIKLSFMFNF